MQAQAGMSEYFAFSPTLQQWVSSGIATGESGKRFDQLPALSSPNNLHILRELIVRRQPRHTLEIGLAFGGSALTILSTLRETWKDGDYSHTAIDPMQQVWDNTALASIKREGLADHFVFVPEPSAYAMPCLGKAGQRFGLIYIDGSHLYEDVFVDMYFACELLEPNGIVLFDDCLKPDVRKVLRFVTRNLSPIVEEIDVQPFSFPRSFVRRVASRFGFRQARAFRRREQTRRAWDAPFANF